MGAHAAVQRLRPHLTLAWLFYNVSSTGLFLEVMLSVGVVGVSVKGKDPPGEVPSMLCPEPLRKSKGYLIGV